MNRPGRRKIVLLGMMTKMPVAGVVWETAQYLLGFEQLGFEAFYVEAHARTPGDLMQREEDDGSALAAEYIRDMLAPFGLGDRWAFHALHEEQPRVFGMSERELTRLYLSAELIVNLYGGTVARPEHYETGRLVYLETDPVEVQIQLHENDPSVIDYLEPHVAFFTWAENYGRSPVCGLPVDKRFTFHPTRMPIVPELWLGGGPDSGLYTTVGNWSQPWRDVVFLGERYSWSKEQEFRKFLDLPAVAGHRFELALSSYEDADRVLLEGHGWRVRHGLDVSTDLDVYRSYLTGSRGEFTVAKDQNVRLRTGWFSDRSAAYLAAGRPVVTQDTGFGEVLPTGEALFPFDTVAEAAAAIETIEADYARAREAAFELVREYFDAGVVLGEMLDVVGVERSTTRGRPSVPYSDDLRLDVVSRRPTVLPEATVLEVMSAPVPAPFPRSGRAEASVVVVTHNNLVFSRMCLASILAHTASPSHEVIVVDNGSGDGTKDFLQRLAALQPSVRLILNAENVGLPHAVNQGLAAARGEVLVVMNNDTIVPPGWLHGLASHLRDSTVGMVGPVTNRIDNEAKVPVDYRTLSEYVAQAEVRARKHRGEAREVHMLAMYCAALRRDVGEIIGPLDEAFQLGLLEDDDYCARLRAAGYRLVCAEDVLVHHFGGASFGKLVPSGEYGRRLARNKVRYEQKWGAPWQPYGRRADPDYERVKTHMHHVVTRRVPPGAVVLVVSRGDDELLDFSGVEAWHFPQADTGVYAGHYPANSDEAIEHLRELERKGAQFLVFPKTSFWWLDHYRGLQAYLERHCEKVLRDPGVCTIYALAEPSPVEDGSPTC